MLGLRFLLFCLLAVVSFVNASISISVNTTSFLSDSNKCQTVFGYINTSPPQFIPKAEFIGDYSLLNPENKVTFDDVVVRPDSYDANLPENFTNSATFTLTWDCCKYEKITWTLLDKKVSAFSQCVVGQVVEMAVTTTATATTTTTTSSPPTTTTSPTTTTPPPDPLCPVSCLRRFLPSTFGLDSEDLAECYQETKLQNLADQDDDGTRNCMDLCPPECVDFAYPNSPTLRAQCYLDNLAVNLGDDDHDGVRNCLDQCPGQDDKIDLNNNGIPDCLETPKQCPPPFIRRSVDNRRLHNKLTTGQ